jgi:hypothetical protein
MPRERLRRIRRGLPRRTILKGGAAVGAFIAFDAIGGVSLAAGASPTSTPLANGVIFPDPTLCIGCLTCEVICLPMARFGGLHRAPSCCTPWLEWRCWS